jgi:hypothetical protein
MAFLTVQKYSKNVFGLKNKTGDGY